ncbi:MAG: hypothetical protein NC930_01595 [Candidatus Omnitrophica bacterium]|nr:hypothetical protein [Candidatus Omnitrophota bacterium]
MTRKISVNLKPGMGHMPILRLQHNLVNILYAIRGLAESYLAQVQEGRFQEVRLRLNRAETVLKKICMQANLALLMTRRIGLVLKVREEAVSYPAASCSSVQTVWGRVIGILRKEFQLDRIEVIERVPEDFPPVQCDPNDLEEIFYHLCKNSLQAMREEAGKLVIRAQLALSDCEEPFAIVTIADTAC